MDALLFDGVGREGSKERQNALLRAQCQGTVEIGGGQFEMLLLEVRPAAQCECQSIARMIVDLEVQMPKRGSPVFSIDAK